MNQNKIFVNRNDRNEYVNEFFDSDASGSKTTLKIKVNPSDDDDVDNENQLNRKRSSSLNSHTANGSSKQRNILTNLLEETTTYKYLNKATRPRNLSIDSAKQKKTDKVAFPMRNSTTSNPYYNSTQTAFYPTWDEWKRQNHRKKKPKIPDDLEKQAQCANDTTYEQQQNNSIFEETSMHNKYSNSNTTTTTTGLVANNKQEAKIPNKLEFNNYNERIKMLDHNQKKNNEVYELKIDKQSSYNKQGKNQHSIPIENFSSSSEKTRNEEVFVGKKNTTNKETTAATAEPKKSYTFQDKIMQEYFDEMESKRKTLLKNDNVSLIHSMSNDGPYKRNTGKIDLNVNQQQQQKNVKSIKSTLKRKDSFDSKNSSRTRLNELSDSDTEIQNRLLAKASGSIPIEYISIRRDNPTPPPFTEKKTKSISVGTNTAVERGKRIASTNTETEPTPLPAYNLHLSLDSLFTKPKREASTSTDRRKVRDAYTVTDDEGIYRVRSEKCINILPVVERRSRKTRHEAADYRLEFLAKSPSVLRKKEYHHQHREQHKTLRYHFDDDDLDGGSDNEQHMMRHMYQEVNVDDDDRLIFGDSRCNKVRSGSFPVLRVPLGDLNENGTVTTRRVVKQSKNTSYVPNIFELDALPLMKTNDQQGANTLWNKQFDEMNMKFNSIFDRNSFRNKQINSTGFIESPAKTQRYYKYSKTTTSDPVPSFGDVFKQNQNGFVQQQHQYRQNLSQQPIVEMPQTPNSTINTRGAYGSGTDSQMMNYRHHEQHRQQQQSFQQQQARHTGPLITQLSTPTDGHRYSNASCQSMATRQYYQQQQHQHSSQNEQFVRKAQSLTNLKPNGSSYSYQHSLKHGNLENNERHFIPIDVHNVP